MVESLAAAEGADLDTPRGRAVRMDEATADCLGPCQPDRDRPGLAGFHDDPTMGISLVVRPELEEVLGGRKPVEGGNAVGPGCRRKSPARHVDLAPSALLVQQPGGEADLGQGLAATVDGLD